MKFLTIYSSEILWNVENVILECLYYRGSNWEFIKYVPKLRKLRCIGYIKPENCFELFANVKKILLDKGNGQTTDDFITIEIIDTRSINPTTGSINPRKPVSEVLREINDIGESIKITPITDLSSFFWSR